MVQLAQVRQRSATLSQRGCSKFWYSSSLMPVVSMLRDCFAAAFTPFAGFVQIGFVGGSRLQFGQHFRATLAARLHQEVMPGGPTNSVSTRSAAVSPETAGPVSIEAQKQVAADCVHCTAIMNAPERRAP